MAVVMVMVLMVVMMTTLALVVLLVVMMVAALAFVVLFMVMVVAALAFVMLFMVMVVATAALMVLLMAVTVATAALVVLLVIVMVATAAALPMFMVVMVLPLPAGGMARIPGIDIHLTLHCPGNLDQFRDQEIRICGGEPQLLGGKSDHSLLHLGVGIELCLDLGSAVGAVQIFDDVYLPGHEEPSFISIYEQSLMCFFQYKPICQPCQEDL
jgi:hypothetical protein